METLVRLEKTVGVDVQDLGVKIKNARKATQKPLTDLASNCGMSVQNWYRIENERQILSLDLLRKIESVLETDFGIPNQLFIDTLIAECDESNNN